jgi:hypothetical protein
MKLSLLFVASAVTICSIAYGQEVTVTDTLLYFGPPQLVKSPPGNLDFLAARLTVDKFAIVFSNGNGASGYQTVKRGVIVRPDSIDFSIERTSNGKHILTGENNIINLERIQAGLYFVRIVFDKHTEILKLFVVSSPD